MICYFKNWKYTKMLKEKEINGIIMSGQDPIPHRWEFKGALLYFRKKLHPISYKLLVASLQVKIIITLWSIQYAFSNSTLKHKLQMFFKAHLRKNFFLCFFRKTYYVKIIAITCMCKVKNISFEILSWTRHWEHLIVLQARAQIFYKCGKQSEILAWG